MKKILLSLAAVGACAWNPVRAVDRNPVDGSVLIRIPATQFTAGSKLAADANPVHTVRLAAFAIGREEVTNRQFKRFIKATGYNADPLDPNLEGTGWHSGADDDERPVDAVNWRAADAYCRWAGLRLPTEDEWELAARGSDGRVYPWGLKWNVRACCNSVGPQGMGIGGRGGHSAAPVRPGSYPLDLSPFGCRDMGGNVEEWTASFWDATHQARVLRGGCWNDTDPAAFRVTLRRSESETHSYSTNGFRVARSL